MSSNLTSVRQSLQDWVIYAFDKYLGEDSFGGFSLQPPDFATKPPTAYFSPVKEYKTARFETTSYLSSGIFEINFQWVVNSEGAYTDVNLSYYEAIYEMLQVSALSDLREVLEFAEVLIQNIELATVENYPIRVVQSDKNTSTEDGDYFTVILILPISISYFVDEILGPDEPVINLDSIKWRVFKQRRDGTPAVVDDRDGYGTPDVTNPPNVLDLDFETDL